MVWYGPWLTPTTTRQGQMADGLGNPTSVGYTLGVTWINSTFANLADGAAGVQQFWPGPNAGPAAEVGYQDFGQGVVRFTPTAYVLAPYPDSPMPPTAVLVDFETPAGTIVASPTVQYKVLGTQTRRTSTTIGLTPLELFDVYDIPAGDAMLSGTTDFFWQNRAALASRVPSLLDARVYGASGTTWTHPQLHSPAPYDPVNLFVASNTQRVASDWASTDFLETLSVGVAKTVEYIGPRYRWVYDSRPPLAHRQRHDGAATAGPPLAHIGTTGSRPPLAWRQHTP